MATDALVKMERAMSRDKIQVNDTQLACARLASQEGSIEEERERMGERLFQAKTISLQWLVLLTSLG